MSFQFYFSINKYINIFKIFKKLFPFLANDSEHSFVIIHERSRMTTNDYERSRTFTNEPNVHERSRTFTNNVHEEERRELLNDHNCN
jgi:hypothetical protein